MNEIAFDVVIGVCAIVLAAFGVAAHAPVLVLIGVIFFVTAATWLVQDV